MTFGLVFPVRVLRPQAQAARILVEEFEAWTARLPALAELVKAASGATPEEVLCRLGPFEQWAVKSIQRHVAESSQAPSKEETEQQEAASKWIELYEP